MLSGAGQVDPTPILMKNARAQGIFVGSRAMFEAMNDAMAQHEIHPVVGRVFAFEELPEALRHMERSAHFGKIILRVS